MSTNKMNPGRLLGISGAYWQTCTLHAGVELDLFSRISRGTCTVKDLAGEVKADERGLAMLLDALSAMDLLEKKEDRYRNTPEAEMFLSRESPGYVGFMIRHHHHLVESWSKLDEAVKTGLPVRKRASYGEEERRESFLMGMFNNAMATAPLLVPGIDLSSRTRLLDLGGGPGTYAVHFCMQNPGLTAAVYDLETTRPFAEKIIKQFSMEDRVEFMPGDYLTQPVTGSFDVAFLSHILHGESPEDCRGIIEKAVKVLEPGGMIIVHEFILDNTRDRPLFPALFSLNMLLGTRGGQAYSQEELVRMLESAGVKEIVRTPFKGPTESGIILGTLK
ncbi:methyltransferase [Desulfospira joergensenii]|uniref:methyltransferase n=1 Tax=Desulfospira joergensenii TaxID=53329 RepID=UPI0003B41789|nr:methyltransferase [Desulfospira joergensenii]